MASEVEEKDTLRDFTGNPAPYLKRLRQSGEPLVLSVEGEGDVVVQDAESYRRFCDQAERLETIAAVKQGLKDVAAGRTRPAREVLAELVQKYNLPLAQPSFSARG